jgi:hypothetical protein
MTMLAGLDNSFEEVNRVRCFNHTLQLSSKTLLKPFNAAIGGSTDDNVSIDCDEDSIPPLVDIEDDEDDEDSGNVVNDDVEDDADEFNALTDVERVTLLADTSPVRQAVSKVSLSHATLILPKTNFC